MNTEQRYTIGELARAAGTTPRTIRYYTAEGLLPPPDSRGKYALYSEDHLLRLQLIARLKAAFLPLGEIRARLSQLDTAQVRQALAQADAPAPPAAESAADYIAQVLASPRRQNVADTPSPAPRAAAPQGLLREGPQPYDAPPSAPQFGYAEVHEARKRAASESLVRRLVPQRATAAHGQPAEPSEQWRRIALVSGVELHIREPLTDAQHEQVKQLLAAARQLFE